MGGCKEYGHDDIVDWVQPSTRDCFPSLDSQEGASQDADAEAVVIFHD
jgi:hypothetical protein